VRIILALVVASHMAAAAGVEPNARRGAMVFKQQRCTMCHDTSPAGDKPPSRFERRPGFDYTPAGMASRMWNHAPRMWSAIRELRLDFPRLTETDAADLFAFFYARHFFERRGDPDRGKRVFEGKCARCHAAGGPGKAVNGWRLPADSVELVQRLWNHAPEMNRVLKTKKRDWPQLASSELADLLAFVQNLPENRSTMYTFSLPTGEGGKALLESKGCTGCHKGFLALEGRLANHTLTDVAASMWNHEPDMRQQAMELSLEEMREILAYIWSVDFFRSRGDVADGRKVFNARCTMCHTNPAAGIPDLKRINRHYSAITMVWALWNHGPKMLQEVEKQSMDWPMLSEADMENLIAFLDFKLRIRAWVTDASAKPGNPGPK
jgi:cytochrome c2